MIFLLWMQVCKGLSFPPQIILLIVHWNGCQNNIGPLVLPRLEFHPQETFHISLLRKNWGKNLSHCIDSVHNQISFETFIESLSL